MTIDKDVFMKLTGELQKYYKRELTPFVQQIWYKHLSERLSTKEFITAIERLIVIKEFMPTPSDLVAAIKGDAEVLALAEWNLCLKAAARADREMISGLSPQGQSALHLIGGLDCIGMASEEKLTWIKKEFLGVWKSTNSSNHSLPQGSSHHLPQASEPVQFLAQKFDMNSSNGKS